MKSSAVCRSASIFVTLIVCVGLLPACQNADTGNQDSSAVPGTEVASEAPPTDQVTTEPSPSPEPVPLTLTPESIWLGIDGFSYSVAQVAPDGTVTTIPLPLNEGQHASNIAAAPGGDALAYLVWEDDTTQHGIATWAVDEPVGRMITTPHPGYRIIAFIMAEDASRIAYVQVSADSPLDTADWRIDVIPTSGGEPRLLAHKETSEGTPVITPFAWPADGPLLLESVLPGDSLYRIDVDGGGSSTVIREARQVVASPALSTGGTWLAYLAIDPTVAGGNQQTADMVILYNMDNDETQTLSAPEGYAVASLKWQPMQDRLLLDLVRPAPDDPGQTQQVWAWASLEQPPPWEQSRPEPEREGLFDYAPFGNGVLYTLLPIDGSWELFLLPDIGDASTPQTISLEALAQESGAPIILYAPLDS